MRLLTIPLVLLGALQGLRSLPASAPPGARERASTEELRFASGTVQLAATLLLPEGDGPFPGVVIVHGSGTSDRSNAWTSAYADALVARGLVVLYPDKRGSGASGGDWHTTSFEGLADDALAALEVLRARPEVRPGAVGLIGFSQGGDVVPVAAARSERVAFVIDVSGSTVPILEQVADEVAKLGEREGLSPDEIGALLELQQLGVHYALSGEGWEDYAAALADLRALPIGESEAVRGFPTAPDAPEWDFARAIGAFDPMSSWRRVRCPALFVYGGRDTQLRVEKSLSRLHELVSAREDAEISVLVLATSGHALFREDELDFLASWIEHGGRG